jgi:vacuolar protein-sorting-associated protein 4
MRRRFEKRVYIALPEARARAHMFKLNLGDTPNSITEAEFIAMGEQSGGYSGSDIAVVVREALMEPLRKCQLAKQFLPDANGKFTPCVEYPNCPHCPMQLNEAYQSQCTGLVEGTGSDGDQCKYCGAVRMTLYTMQPEKLQVPLIDFADFKKALGRAHSSVGADELDRFIAWTEEFGQEG